MFCAQATPTPQARNATKRLVNRLNMRELLDLSRTQWATAGLGTGTNCPLLPVPPMPSDPPAAPGRETAPAHQQKQIFGIGSIRPGPPLGCLLRRKV
jgi:hypothetical protein